MKAPFTNSTLNPYELRAPVYRIPRGRLPREWTARVTHDGGQVTRAALVALLFELHAATEASDRLFVRAAGQFFAPDVSELGREAPPEAPREPKGRWLPVHGSGRAVVVRDIDHPSDWVLECAEAVRQDAAHDGDIARVIVHIALPSSPGFAEAVSSVRVHGSFL